MKEIGTVLFSVFCVLAGIGLGYLHGRDAGEHNCIMKVCKERKFSCTREVEVEVKP